MKVIPRVSRKIQYDDAFVLNHSIDIFSNRAVHLYPHRFVGTVGHHGKDESIEALDVSHDGELIASISHDQCVKFWNIKYLEVSVLKFRKRCM